MRRLVKTLMMVVVLTGGAIFGLYKMHVDIPLLNTHRIYASLDYMGVEITKAKGHVESYFKKDSGEETHLEPHKVVITSPLATDVTITQEYVCQIRSQRHIDVRALEDGYLEAILVKEGQAVKADDTLFQVKPVIYKAELAAEVAERDLAQLELDYTKTLADKQGVSQKEVSLYKAKLARCQAKVELAQAKLNFATIRAPFDGIIDRLELQQGSLVKEGDMLTTLSDNSVMWVYFNVTEKRYLEYMAESGQGFDLRLMPSLSDASEIPAEARNLIIVAEVGNVLHFRMFGMNGKRIVDTTETELGKQSASIADLKKHLAHLWTLRDLTKADKDKVVATVTPIVGYVPEQSPDIELILANHNQFPQIGKIGAIESNFNNETGNIAFRADFPNPVGLLRYGQTGTVLIKRLLKKAIVIPQRATFENLAKRYVYIVGENDVVHQHEISIEHEQDDIFVIGNELGVNDRIILEGIRQVREGTKVEGEFLRPEEVLKDQKYHAE